jgi:hypothetical protein
MTFLTLFATLVPRTSPLVAPPRRVDPAPPRHIRPLDGARADRTGPFGISSGDASIPAARDRAHVGPKVESNGRRPQLVCRWGLDGSGRLVASWVAADHTTLA